jgi:DNA-binding response OmpR family regulator
VKLLLVEDDKGIAAFLRRGLAAAGHVVAWATEGTEAIGLAAAECDAVILDLMLPDLDGLDVCRQLRAARWDLPILILSARDQVGDRVAGLNAGADDFLVKPFAFAELLARLAAIRRRNAPPPAAVAVGTLILDRDSRTVRRADRVIEVTQREFQLLEYLVKNRDRVVTRAAILSQVWGADADVSDNSVDVYIGYLRRKLDLGEQLATVRGVGFRLSLAP